jgi:hypothetical protein
MPLYWWQYATLVQDMLCTYIMQDMKFSKRMNIPRFPASGDLLCVRAQFNNAQLLVCVVYWNEFYVGLWLLRRTWHPELRVSVISTFAFQLVLFTSVCDFNMAVLIRSINTAEVLNCVAWAVLGYVQPATARPLIGSSNPIQCMRVRVFELLRCSVETCDRPLPCQSSSALAHKQDCGIRGALDVLPCSAVQKE